MKRRKLTPKIEKMFKKLELKYNLKNTDTSITLRETNVLNSDAIHNFKLKYGVYIRLGIGCIVIDDTINNFSYFICYNKNNKRFIECRDDKWIKI